MRPSPAGPWTLSCHCSRPPRPGCPDSPRMARPLAQPPPGRCRRPRGPWRQRQKEGAPPNPEGRVRPRGARDVASTGDSQRWTQPGPTLATEAAAGLLCPPQGAGRWVGPLAALRAHVASGRARFPAKRPGTLQACLPLHPPSRHPSSALLALGSTAGQTGSSQPGAAGSGAWGGAGGGLGVDRAGIGVRGAEPRAP